MYAIFLVVLLAFIAGALSVPVFEAAVVTLLLSPILGSVVGHVFPLNPISFALLFFAILLTVYLTVHRGQIRFRKPRWDAEGLRAVAVFCILYSVLYGLNLLWPDFISIGERLRDYAILAAVHHNPIHPDEPWLYGVTMRYYLYWYRFGHMLATILGLQVWQLYHVLGAFTFALFASSIFFLFHKHLSFRPTHALWCALLICFGSNVSGVLYFLLQDPNWWGPSRVIQGAITEFPVWSFLLGDLHPHYLNLCLMPFLISIFMSVRAGIGSVWERVIFLISIIVVPLGWLYSSANPWELPVWLILGTVWALYIVLSYRGNLLQAEYWKKDPALPPSMGLALVVVGLCLMGYSFFDSAQNLPVKDYKLAYVLSNTTPQFISSLFQHLGLDVMAVPGTSREELLLHWGIPIGIIVASSLLLAPSRELVISIVALVVVGSLANSATPILLLLLALALLLFYVEVSTAWHAGRPLTPKRLLIHALGAASFLTIIFPEFFFLNDSYGGENERMNTIFKFYSTAWFMLHAYAFCLAASVIPKIPRLLREGYPARLALLAISTLMLGFGIKTIDLRASHNREVDPRERGLSEIERTYPGAAQAIEILTNSPYGVVLEAQGPPYSATTHVATIAGQQSYLGWSNHVGLLTGMHSEVQARESFTESIYREPSCIRRAELLREKHIDYLVVGPLETTKYQNLKSDDFSCLKLLVSSGAYRIFLLQ